MVSESTNPGTRASIHPKKCWRDMRGVRTGFLADWRVDLPETQPRRTRAAYNMNPLVASYAFTEEVALHAHRELVRAVTPWVRYLPLFGLLIASVPLIASVSNPRLLADVFTPSLLTPVLFGALFCATPFLIRWQVRRQFRSNPNAGLEVTWRIDAMRLSIATQGSSSVFEWKKLVRVKEVKDGFLLFTHPKLAQWLPNSAFESPDDVEQFRCYMRENGVRT